MIEQFKEDYFQMMKLSMGYLPWVKKHPYRLDRLIWGEHEMCHRHRENHHRQLVRKMLEEKVCENESIDIFFKAVIRAEQRFSSRFIPQRSNEERLTGHLISEIGGSIELVKSNFLEASLKLYNESKVIDFFYFDMSKGGKLEKITGADLAITVIIDLPDFPKTIKTYIFQAKKIQNSTSIDNFQYKTLMSHRENSYGYLFYDGNLQTLSSPFVLQHGNMKYLYEKAIENKHNSFSVNNDTVYNGLPLSAFLCFELISNDFIGRKHNSIEDAISYAEQFNGEKNERFNGYFGVVSIGRKLKYEINSNNEGFNLTLD